MFFFSNILLNEIYVYYINYLTVSAAFKSMKFYFKRHSLVEKYLSDVLETECKNASYSFL